MKLFLFLHLLFPWILLAQNDDKTPVYAPRGYPFINYDANVLFQPDALNPFFEKLAKLESEKRGMVHILHIGDSHLQADYFSGEVRKQFQQDPRFGNAGRGFIFPYSVARTNNPEDYRTRYTGVWEGFRSVKRTTWSQWGLAGVTAITYDPRSTITIQPVEFRGSYPSPIKRLKIFYPVFDEKSFVPKLLTDPKNIARSQIHADGYISYELRKPLWEVTMGLQRFSPSESRFLMQGLQLENGHSGIMYSMAGANGAEVSTYLRCEDLDKHVKAIKPDLVIISLGTNDAYFSSFDDKTYKHQYTVLIQKIKAVVPEVVFLLTTPGDNLRRRRYTNKNNVVASRRIQEIAQEEGVAVWNFYEVMGGFKSVQQWYRYGLSQRDKLHFTFSGYQLQGQLLFEALDRSYRSYWENSFIKNP